VNKMKLVHDGIKVDKHNKNAMLFDFEGNEVWIPRSVIGEYNDVEVTIKDWFAEENGLEVYEI